MHTPRIPYSDAPDTRRFLLVSFWSLALIVAWDASGLDLALARLFGDANGFALTHNWWLQHVLHSRARLVGWLVFAVLLALVWWPIGPWRRLTRRERVGLVLGVALAALAVQLLKRGSQSSCPWDLMEFGGTARYVSHWQWGVRDGGGGHCFPAGHASTGFAYLGVWFWLRRAAPKAATAWLIGALLVGLGLGLVQQVRGAHYMSHTLWTAWLCWVVSGTVWWVQRRITHATPKRAPAHAA